VLRGSVYPSACPGKSKLRTIWSYAGLAGALLLAAVLVVPGFLDWSRYAGLIEAQAEKITGRDVKIGGDVRIALLPSPKLTVDGITIANAQGAPSPHMVSIRSIGAELSVGSLFRGDLMISRLTLSAPRLWLEETEEGQGNWIFDPIAKDSPEPDVQGADGASNQGRPPLSLDQLPPVVVEEVEIEGGTIAFRGLGIGGDLDISDINGLVATESLSGPYRAKGSAQIAGQTTQFLATLDEVAADKAIPTNLLLEFEDAEATFSGIVTGRGADIRFDGAVDAGVAAGLSPVLGALTAGQSAELSAGIVASPAGVTLREMQAQAGAVQLSGSVAASAGPVLSIDADLGVNRVDFTGFGTAGIPLSFEKIAQWVASAVAQTPAGSYRLAMAEVRLPRGRITNADITAEAGGETISVSSFSGELPGGTRMNASGAVALGQEGAYFSGDVDLASVAPDELVTWTLNDDVPHLLSAHALEELDASASVFLTPARLSLDKLDVLLDGGRVTGQYATSFDTRPQIDASLAVEAVRLPEINPMVFVEALASRPVNMPFDGHVELDVAAMDIGDLHVEDVSLDLVSDGSDLTIQELLFRSAEGASVTLSGNSGVEKGAYQTTVTAPDVASLVGLVPLPPQSLARVESLSLSGQLEWPFESVADEEDMVLADAIGLSVIGRAGPVQVEAEGQLVQAATDPNRLAYDITTTFLADDWRDLASLGSALLVINGPIDAELPSIALEEAPAVTADTPQKVTVVAEGIVNGPVVLAAQAATRAVSGTIAGQADVSASPLTYELDADIDVAMPGALASAVGHRLRDVDVASVTGQLAFDGLQHSFNLAPMRVEGRGGTVDLDVAGSIRTANSRRSGDVTVQLREIDLTYLRTLLAEGDQAEESGNGVTEEANPNGDVADHWGSDLMDLSFFDLADITFEVSGTNVAASRLTIEQLDVSGSLEERVLDIPAVRAAVLGGEVRGALRTTAENGLRLNVSAAGTGLDVGTMGEALGLGLVGTGTGAFDLTFEGRGLSELALVSSLTGEGKFQLLDGALTGIDIAALSDGLIQLADPVDFSALADATLNVGATAFDVIEGDIQLTSGVARAPEIDISIDAASASASAFMDVGRLMLDMEAKFTVNEPRGAPAASIIVAGAISALERSVDAVALEAFAGRHILKKEIEALGGDSSEIRVLLEGQDAPVTSDRAVP